MPPVRLHQRLRLACRLLLLAFIALLMAPSALAITKSVTDADKGGSAQLKMGDILEVRLRSNPTTGYMWYVHPKSTPLLKLIGQSQTQTPQPGVGRPILQVFRFQAVSAGEGVLLLHYIRSWERPLQDEEQYDLRISIR